MNQHFKINISFNIIIIWVVSTKKLMTFYLHELTKLVCKKAPASITIHLLK